MGTDLNLAEEVDFIKKDIKFAVDFIDVSPKLPEKDGRIYINIQTKEKDKFCVELSSSGFKVVGNEFDCNQGDEVDNNQVAYETVYSLLSNISSSYERTFGDELARKLSNLTEDAE